MSITAQQNAYSKDDHSTPSSSKMTSRPESPSYDPKGSLILRIKRKRGVDPITALRIETLRSEEDGETNKDVQSLTSTSPEEGIQTRPKRRLTDRGVFRLAETVSLSSFDNLEQTKELEKRIAQLKNPKIESKKEEKQAKDISDRKDDRHQTTTNPHSDQKASSSGSNPTQLRFKVVPSSTQKSSRRSLFETLKANNSSSSLRLKKRQLKTSARADRPPEIHNSRPTPYSRRPRYIDAVVEGSPLGRSREKILNKKDSQFESDIDSLDRRFAGLLGDYLKRQDLEPPKDILDAAANAQIQQPKDGTEESSSDEDDYVYDIYYREKAPSFTSNLAASAAQIGMQPSEVAGHERQSSYNNLSSSTLSLNAQTGAIVAPEVMATLVGLSERDYFGDEDEDTIEEGSRLISEELLDSDDPYEEGEDEDSNDEDFYRNDYPEQEAEEEEDMEALGWGWSGPRRHRQSDSDDDDESEEEEEEDF